MFKVNKETRTASITLLCMTKEIAQWSFAYLIFGDHHQHYSPDDLDVFF